jgi:hypothetical protein
MHYDLSTYLFFVVVEKDQIWKQFGEFLVVVESNNDHDFDQCRVVA